MRSGEQGFSQRLNEKMVAAGSKISHIVRENLRVVLPAAVFMAANGCAQIIGIEDWGPNQSTGAGGMVNTTSSSETSSSGTGGNGGQTVSSSSVGGQGGAGGGPAENVTFDTIAMGCFKAVVLEDATGKVVQGAEDTSMCPTELPGIYVPPVGHTMIVWVQDPTNNLLSFNSAEGFTISKARCSTYPTAPTWTQIENDYATQTFGLISNGAVPPGYLFTKSCPSDAEYQIHK